MQDIKREKTENHNEHTLVIEGRNAVLEAFRSGRTIDKLFVLDGCQDGPVRTIVREAKKAWNPIKFCGKRTPEPAFADREASGRDRLCSGL